MNIISDRSLWNFSTMLFRMEVQIGRIISVRSNVERERVCEIFRYQTLAVDILVISFGIWGTDNKEMCE